jgi:hypothetical protein
MKYLRRYKLFEARFTEFKEIVTTIKDICQDFEDFNCHCEIFPKDDIKLNIVSLKSRGYIGSIDMPFYLTISINPRIKIQDENRSGFYQLPEWFIENCKRIEDYMGSVGFETLPSVRFAADWMNLESIDDLEENSLIYKVKLEFIPNEVSKEI